MFLSRLCAISAIFVSSFQVAALAQQDRYGESEYVQRSLFSRSTTGEQASIGPVATLPGHQEVLISYRGLTLTKTYHVVTALIKVREIRPAGNGRVVLSGDGGPAMQGFALIDSVSERQVSSVLCLQPALSPSGRYVAFVAYEPPHGGNFYSLSNVYRIADVEELPASRDVPLAYNVGVEVYPKSQLPNNLPKFSFANLQLVHQMVGDFEWIDETHVRFKDSFRRVTREITVTAPIGSGRAPRSRDTQL